MLINEFNDKRFNFILKILNLFFYILVYLKIAILLEKFCLFAKVPWIWAVSNLTMQSKLTQIVIDTFLPSSVKAEINKNEWDVKIWRKN
ncbi:hypothetical protein KW512_01655 [Mesomycoplasma ovipneumoniae]|uniref:hypothetical protein n=1 Tax=Mesomycoplasma ovipneumoniae TaxID=29562 RepID=UPI002161B976|nr:hypothetical protein [Mesomycoplasma ovipneumoniae]UVO15562.1 hypothetical protein KW512_01655 [Mesomycoplasma ovipneumoniae]